MPVNDRTVYLAAAVAGASSTIASLTAAAAVIATLSF